LITPEAMTFAETLRGEIRRIMNELTDRVALGQAESFDQYQRMVGQIEGLAVAERELLTLSKQPDED
tara:strand:- start:7638 stop:7838 length:201 start_codon:yes stop_codon:yes gene_type:complete